jgi:hypothetical protein
MAAFRGDVDNIALESTDKLVVHKTDEGRVLVSVSPSATELQLMQLRQRTLDALVIDTRRIAPQGVRVRAMALRTRWRDSWI